MRKELERKQMQILNAGWVALSSKPIRVRPFLA